MVLGNVVIGKMPGGQFANAAGDANLGTDAASAYNVTVLNGASISHSFAPNDGYYGLDLYNRNTLALCYSATER